MEEDGKKKVRVDVLLSPEEAILLDQWAANPGDWASEAHKLSRRLAAAKIIRRFLECESRRGEEE